jgi:hypothetical protein
MDLEKTKGKESCAVYPKTFRVKKVRFQKPSYSVALMDGVREEDKETLNVKLRGQNQTRRKRNKKGFLTDKCVSGCNLFIYRDLFGFATNDPKQSVFRTDFSFPDTLLSSETSDPLSLASPPSPTKTLNKDGKQRR